MTKKVLKTERLYPIRIDKPLKDELKRISEEMGLKKSEVVRVGIKLFIEKNTINQTMQKMKDKTDLWYIEKGK